MSVSTTPLISIINRPIPNVSDQFKVCYWEVHNMLAACNENPHELDLYSTPYYRKLQYEERQLIMKVINRHALRYEDATTREVASIRTQLARVLLSNGRRRKYAKRFFGKAWKLNTLIDQFISHHYGDPQSRYSMTSVLEFLKKNPIDLRKQVGNFFHRAERTYLRSKAPAAVVEQPYYMKLPLYECSGELECTRANFGTRVASIHRDYWDMGRDGGGQPEIRFRISGNLPRLACSKVVNLGPATKNGGHIHLNCRKDEWVGQRTFFAFRYHMSWFRYLEPYARRNHRHASVDAVPREWRNAKGYKFAAISANCWSRYGTVEIRLWGPSRNPKDWAMRSELMKAMARWAEYAEMVNAVGENEQSGIGAMAATVPYPGQDNPEARPLGHEQMPVPHWMLNPPLCKNENSKVAFMDFARWCAVSAPDVLRWVLKKFAKKASAPRDARAQEMARTYVRMFNESSIRLPRYRRPRVITPQPTQSV